MANLQTHPLVRAAYNVCLLIEACGASEALTRAVSAASAMLDPIEALALERDALKAENARLREAIQTALGSPAMMGAQDIEVLADALEAQVEHVCLTCGCRQPWPKKWEGDICRMFGVPCKVLGHTCGAWK